MTSESTPQAVPTSAQEVKTPTPPAVTDDQQRRLLYSAFREELVKKQNSNSENYDRSILTLSSGGLGLSLAFTKDVVPLSLVTDISLLVLSWAAFAAAIVATIGSFQTSQLSIRTSMRHAEEYYLRMNDAYLARRNIWADVTAIFNFISGIFFVAAVAMTAYFIGTNLPPTAMTTPKQPAPSKVTAPPPPVRENMARPIEGKITLGQPVNNLVPVSNPPPKKN